MDGRENEQDPDDRRNRGGRCEGEGGHPAQPSRDVGRQSRTGKESTKRQTQPAIISLWIASLAFCLREPSFEPPVLDDGWTDSPCQCINAQITSPNAHERAEEGQSEVEQAGGCKGGCRNRRAVFRGKGS